MDIAFLETKANRKIQHFQLVLKDIQVYDELRVVNRDILTELDFLKSVWLNTDPDEFFDANRVFNIEERLITLPFELAISHVDPSYRTMALKDIWLKIFKDESEWRMDPSLVMLMSREDKERIYTNFEFMCYYVINTCESLLFEIKYALEIEE
jgi:hypothetical protein